MSKILPIGTPFVKAYHHIVFDSDLSGNAVRLLLALDSFSNRDKTNKIFPSTRKLAEMIGLNKRSVQRYRSELESRGYLKTIMREGRSNLYELHLEPKSPIEEPCEEEIQVIDKTIYEDDQRQPCLKVGDKSVQGGRQICPGGGDKSVQGGVTNLSTYQEEPNQDELNQDISIVHPRSARDERVTQDDLDKIYQKYPRKTGRKKGMAKALKTILKSELPILERGVTNYANAMKAEKRDSAMIKQWSSFIESEEWRDYEEVSGSESSSDEWGFVKEEKEKEAARRGDAN